MPKGGVPSYQRALGAEVRDLTLKEIRAVLLGEKDYGAEFKKQMLLRLAGSALPRISEISGEDGEPLQIKVVFPDGKDDSITRLAGDSNPSPAEI